MSHENTISTLLFVFASLILYGARIRRDYMLAGTAVPFFLGIAFLQVVRWIPNFNVSPMLRANVITGLFIMQCVIVAVYAMNGKIEALLDAAYIRGLERMKWQEPLKFRREVPMLFWVVWYGIPSIANALARQGIVVGKKIAERISDDYQPQ